MMKRIYMIVAVIFIFLIGGYYIVQNKVGDVMPIVLPPKEVAAPAIIGEKINLPFSLPPGFSIGIFAKGLGGVRDMEFTPGGTLLASITGENKVVALPDKNNDGKADEVKEIFHGFKKPHGLAFYKNKLYIAEETRVGSYNWDENNLIAFPDTPEFSLPGGGRHFTRTLVFDKSGKLYISVGSICDVCVEKNPMNGSILISDPVGTTPRIFAKGLRNSVFIALNQSSGEVWATEMGRDFLGDNTPPDEVNIIRDGGDYGWPICYGKKIHDTNFDKRVYFRDPCENSQPPIYEIPAHSAPLGLTFIDSKQFPAGWQGDLLVAYHGSWNRPVPSGYKVVHMKVKDNQILSEEDFLTGFLSGNQAFARPVDLVFDKSGSLYVSDDKAGYIFKVIKAN